MNIQETITLVLGDQAIMAQSIEYRRQQGVYVSTMREQMEILDIMNHRFIKGFKVCFEPTHFF